MRGHVSSATATVKRHLNDNDSFTVAAQKRTKARLDWQGAGGSSEAGRHAKSNSFIDFTSATHKHTLTHIHTHAR